MEHELLNEIFIAAFSFAACDLLFYYQISSQISENVKQ